MVEDRVRDLNDEPTDRRGSYVLYWMQQSQRAESNPALEHAIALANESGLGVVVVFGLHEDYPEANERHFAFMLEGLAEVAEGLRRRGIKLVVRRSEPDRACLELATRAALVVCDRGYLRHQVAWRERVARRAGKRVVEVEGDVVVPVDVASNKREYAARTLRPKLERRWQQYLVKAIRRRPRRDTTAMRVAGELDPRNVHALLERLVLDRSVRRVERFEGGTSAARRRLQEFLRRGLKGYAEARNDPADPQCSNLSPYLHFGQISPVEVARKASAARGGEERDRAAFLEELIVRRELAINFVRFEPDYDHYESLPGWARDSLAAHGADRRSHVYSRRELERAATHDPYWNAAMKEMVKTGYMHNYMRMYWGKKIIEWSATPEQAYDVALALNNRYFIDGRDPNSYAGVGWLFGLHDRPWTEREVFGKVRYMNARGLERKFDIESYVQWADALEG